MPAQYTPISEQEMRSLLEGKGFSQVSIPGTVELVFGKIVAPNLCLRVYTSIVPYTGTSRDVGEDAIRVCLVFKKPDGNIVGVGKDRRVHRTQNWKDNLLSRLSNWTEQIAFCARCSNPMRLIKNRTSNEYFLGCSIYPTCKATKNV